MGWGRSDGDQWRVLPLLALVALMWLGLPAGGHAPVG